MVQIKTWVSVGLLGVMATACGGAEDAFPGNPEGSEASGPTIAELPQALTTIFCDAFEACVGPMAKLQFRGQSCEEEFGKTIADGNLSLLQDAVDEGKVAYHRDKAQACLDAMAAQGCELFTTRMTPECLEAIVGSVAENEPCTLGFECEGTLFCKADATCPGVCTAPQQEGAACNESDDCVDGLVCDDNLEVCATPRQLGETCDGEVAGCAMGLSCWGDDQGPEPKKCISNDALFSLDRDAECYRESDELCAVDSYCVIDVDMDAQPPALVGKCEAGVAAGAACTTALPDQCPNDEYCKTPEARPQEMPDFNGTCTALPVAGDACRTGNAWAPRCATGTACVNDTCETIARLGKSCTGDAACYSGTCEKDLCVVPTACTN